MKKERAHCVDGFDSAVPKRNINAYRRMAKMGSKIWREHGALEFRECVGDDWAEDGSTVFPNYEEKT